MKTNELAYLTTVGDSVRITLRRAPLNFLNRALLSQIEDCLEYVGDSPACKALILDSDVAAFCAGLDLVEQTQENAFLLLEQFHRVIRAVNSFPRPTIAIVNGIALGAGNELISCCDYVVASDKSSFGQPEIKVGTIPTVAPLILPTLIGHRRALDLILTGRLVSAKEAESIGLIHCAVAEEALPAAVESLLNIFRVLSTSVLELALQSVRGQRTRELEGNLRQTESRYLNELMDLEDATEGMNAFLEKRTPRWSNH